MRQKLAGYIQLLVFSTAIILTPVALVTGCKSAPKVAYTAAQATTITVEGAMGLWDKYVQEKHPGPVVESKVKSAYDSYRQADIVLLQAGKAVLQDQSKTNSTAWSQAEAALTTSANDFYNLLKSIGVKLP